MASSVQITGLRELGEVLKKLPKEIASKNGGPLRAALFQGAKVIRDEARVRAPVRTSKLSPKREAKQPPGTLKRNIVATRDRDPARSGQTENYVIRPKTGKNRKTGDAYYWRWVELGHRIVPPGQRKAGRRAIKAGAFEGGNVPPKPFMRPAFEAKKEEAVAKFAQSLAKGITRAVVKAGGRAR